MNGESGFIEIALELKSGRLDKLFVIGVVRYRREFTGDIGSPHPSQVDVDEAIRAGKQPGGLGWGMFAEHDSQSDRCCNQQNGQKNGEAASYSHVSAAEAAHI